MMLEIVQNYLESRIVIYKITEIINLWDPIGLFPMAPRNEYVDEIKKIYEFIISNPNICVYELAEKINSIFAETFGLDVYNQDIKQCILVAEEVLKKEDGISSLL